MREALIIDERGGVAVMAAAAAGLVCALAAAIDVGAVALEARRLQGAADLAALSAVADLTRAEQIARTTAAANSPDLSDVRVELGSYDPDPDLAPDRRFQFGGTDPDAVRVTLSKQTPLYFGAMLLGRPTFSLTRSARAAAPVRPRAAFSIGSRAAALDGGVANAVLSGLTGSAVSLSVADYQALASADVDLLSWWRALATEVGVDAARTDAVLAGRVDAGRLMTVVAPLADASARPALAALTTALGGRRLDLSHLIALEPGAADLMVEGLEAKVSALDVVMAAATLAGGDRQVKLNLAAGLGLAALEADLAIGEPPNASAWLTVTRDGAPVVRTRQARLWLRATTSDKLAGLAQVQLPLLVELAPAEARLSHIDCAGGTVGIEARPGLARVQIGAVDTARLGDFTRDLTPDMASLMTVPGLVSITGRSTVEAAQTSWKPLAFTRADLAARTVKSVSTTTLARSAVASAVRRLDADVKVLGLGLGLGGLTQQLGQLLTPVARTLDGLINPLLALLGVRVGEADVRLNGLDCSRGGPRLVG